MTVGKGLAIGDTVGKYRITEKIGQGGMGEVFGAVHDGLGRAVAIKLLRARFAEDEQLLARFWQEAEAVSRIGHAHIVSVYDFGRTDGGESYYVMERIEGESLAARLRREPPLSPAETNAIFGQLCRALGAVHARGIVHRDLKPDNILLQTQPSGLPHVKVVDFGVAKVRGPSGGLALGQAAGNLTAAGTLLGTPAYMAPEQIMAAQHVDGRADVYSLGAMLYQVLTGAPPFAGEELAVLMAHVRDEVPAPSTKAPGIAPAMDALVLKALAKEPAQRHADASQFAAALDALLAPAASTSAATAASVPSARRSQVALAVAAGLVVAAAIAWAAWRARVPATTAPRPVAASAATTSPQRGARLMEAARAGDAVDRRAALNAIAALEVRRGLDAVTRALGDDEPEVRRAAAEAARAIGRPGDASLAAALTRAGEASGGSLALDVTLARAQLGDPAALDELGGARTQPDPTTRLKASLALADRGKLPAAELRQALALAPTARRALRWDAYASLYRLGDAGFRHELDGALAGDDDVARLDAAVTLARAGDARGAATLAALAKSDDPSTHLEAEALLAEAGDAAARDVVVLRLAGLDVPARQRAALALGRLAHTSRDGAALAALARALTDGDRVVRLTAAAAFWSAP